MSLQYPEDPPPREIHDQLGNSFYDGGTDPPEWMTSIVTISPGADALRLGSPAPLSKDLLAGRADNPSPWTGTSDLHLLKPAPGIGDGFIVGADWSKLPAGWTFDMMIYNPMFPAASHMARAQVENGQMIFGWAGDPLVPEGPFGDRINDIYEASTIINLGAPQHYLRLGFNGSGTPEGRAYWSLSTGDTLSGFGVRTGDVADSALEILTSTFFYHRDTVHAPATTLRPIDLEQFGCYASVVVPAGGTGYFDIDYWEINCAQDVSTAPFYHWMIAGPDLKWHKADQNTASYYLLDESEIVYDWAWTDGVKIQPP